MLLAIANANDLFGIVLNLDFEVDPRTIIKPFCHLQVFFKAACNFLEDCHFDDQQMQEQVGNGGQKLPSSWLSSWPFQTGGGADGRPPTQCHPAHVVSFFSTKGGWCQKGLFCHVLPRYLKTRKDLLTRLEAKKVLEWSHSWLPIGGLQKHDRNR